MEYWMRIMMNKIRNWLSLSPKATRSLQRLEHPVGAKET